MARRYSRRTRKSNVTNRQANQSAPEASNQSALEAFTKDVGRTLYPYQLNIAQAILDSVTKERGLTFTVLLARQMGKNEISALVEAYLLMCMREGTIVKAAPTYKPQILNSHARLHSMIEKHPVLQTHAWHAQGYIIGVSPTNQPPMPQTGPRVLFLSASPDAHIVGATASLLLEVDEAQDVSIEKFNRDLRPMAATTNCTTVLYGTAWSEDTLLAQVKVRNQELEQQDGIRRHFEYDWRTLAALNPKYKEFVENEISQLGPDHQTIRTQYRLQPIGGVGFLLSENQRHLLRGRHYWLNSPDEDSGYTYVAGLDVGGEARPRPGTQKQQEHASTVLTIARVGTNEVNLKCLTIVHQARWTGKPLLEQYAQCLALCELWDVRRLVIDKTGLGEGIASLLSSKLGQDKVVPFHFTRQSKSKLTYQFLSFINTGRLKMYRDEGAPDDIRVEAWKQLKLARYKVPGENLLDMYVDPEDGHDDFLISIALCCEAVREPFTPCFDSVWIPPRPLDPWERLGW